MSRQGTQHGSPSAFLEGLRPRPPDGLPNSQISRAPHPTVPALWFPRRRAGSDLITMAWIREALPAVAAVGWVWSKQPLSFWVPSFLWADSRCVRERRRPNDLEVGGRGGGWFVGPRGRGLPGLPGGFAFRLEGSRPRRPLYRRRMPGAAAGALRARY